MFNFLKYLSLYFIDMVTPGKIFSLALLGAVVLSYFSFLFLYTIYQKFLVRGKNIATRYGHGSWAVVTGGAEGIGRSFAKQLACKGFNLVILDKQSELLNETTRDISQKYPNIEVRKIVTDFSHCQKEGYFDYLANELTGLDISVLVNNAGILHYGKFSDMNDKDLMDIVNVNIVPVMMLTKKLLPRLLARPQRSAVITLSSNESLHPYPYFAAYGATKSFLTQFMTCLEREFTDNKIDFLTVTPALVSTKMTNFPPINYHTCGPDDVARSSLKSLGNHDMTYGHWKHELFAPFFNKTEAGRRMGTHEIIRLMDEGRVRMQKTM